MYKIRENLEVEVVAFKRGGIRDFATGELMRVSAKLRYHALLPLNWDTHYNVQNDTEDDEYDNDAAINFLCLVNGIPVSYIRLNRTDYDFESSKMRTRSYMLRDVFADRAHPERYLLEPKNLKLKERDYKGPPRARDIREMSRLVVQPQFLKDPITGADPGKALRHIGVSSVGAAMLQYCRNPVLEPEIKRIRQIVGVMYPGTWDSVWRYRGVPQTYMGPVVDLAAEARMNFDPSSGKKMPEQELVVAGSIFPTDTCVNRILNVAKVPKPDDAFRAFKPPPGELLPPRDGMRIVLP